MKETYIFYWAMPDNTKQYLLDDTTQTPFVFSTYQECWQVGQNLMRPVPTAKPCFEVVKV